jgi:hypothetical protein
LEEGLNVEWLGEIDIPPGMGTAECCLSLTQSHVNIAREPASHTPKAIGFEALGAQ